jgi:hypothetical protein
MEIAVVAEAEKIELEALGFNHFDIGNVTYADFREVRLPCNGAKRSELGTVETYPVVMVLVLVDKGLEHFGSIVVAVFRFGAKGLEALIFSVV